MLSLQALRESSAESSKTRSFPDWTGQTVAIMANGPSLTIEQTDLIHHSSCRSIAINAVFQWAPWADIFYGADAPFWEHHAAELSLVEGLRLCGDDEKRVQSLIARGIVDMKLDVYGDPSAEKFEPGKTSHGQHSGYQALALAISLLRKHGRVLLLGYDCRKTDKPNAVTKADKFMRDSPYLRWAQEFNKMPKPEGVEIFNCTPGSAIKAFPFADLSDVL